MTMDAPDEQPVIIKIDGAFGRLTLNRPRALHALSTEMCRLMIDALLAWRDDESVRAVLIDHSGPRGFCAGGDIRAIADSGAGDGIAARQFFELEYRLNALLFDYAKPVVAIMDGVVMGGGVGISAPANYRVATERTTFAMPETGIGLFPDVGGGWFLPRLPGEAGMWLGLTGTRLKAADCLLLGLATDYVVSTKIELLKAALIARPEAIDSVITEFEDDAGQPPLADHQDVIARTFAGDSVEAILAALTKEASPWASNQLQLLKTKSPLAMKVAHRQLRHGAKLASFNEQMIVEYRLASRICRLPDFAEGVRAVIVDKDNAPRWTPESLADVTVQMIDDIFSPLLAGQEWSPLR